MFRYRLLTHIHLGHHILRSNFGVRFMKNSAIGYFVAIAILACTFLNTHSVTLAAEEIVTFDMVGEKIVGTLETPEGDPAPVVLMLHGFTGSRDELPIKDTDEGVFSRTARLLAEAGIASLRIDFRGSGESDGVWEDTTFSDQIADAVIAIDWLQSNPSVDGANISILGWSQGGLVATHVAAARPEIKSLVLWAPVTNPLATFSRLLGAETIAAAVAGPADKTHTTELPWGVETTLKGRFFLELATTSPAGAITVYPGPMLVIVGTRDTIVTPQPGAGRLLLNYHDGPEKLIVLDTDHVWDAFVGPSILDEKMIPATLDWLRLSN